MNLYGYFNELRRDDEPRSRIPPKPPARRWVETRVCRCTDGACRSLPPRPCPGTGQAVQLYCTAPRGPVA